MGRKGRNGKRFPGQDKQDKQDLIYDNDKSHQGWRAKENENFAKVFYKHQSECPTTADSKLICMKFFLHGVCTKDCTRAHSLSADDSKKFESFINSCREKAPKQDVWRGTEVKMLLFLCPSHLNKWSLLNFTRLKWQLQLPNQHPKPPPLIQSIPCLWMI